MNLLKDKKIKNLLYSFLTNIISFIAALISAFIVPKALNVDQYGVYKLFGFYITYVGLLHFGFNDGIYIKYGKYDYEDVPKEKFRMYFKFIFIFQLAVSVLFIVLADIFIADHTNKLIFIFISINIIVLNLHGFFNFISQFVRNFKLYSYNNILNRILFVLSILLLLFLNKINAFWLILLQTAINLSSVIIFFIYYKDIITGKAESIRSNYKDLADNFKIGILNMIGNLMAMIIVGVDRFFIDRFYTIRDFAMYSFAFSILSLLYILVNSISTVVYPYLVRGEVGEMDKAYKNIKLVILILIGFGLSSFFIMKFIVLRFLPKYTDSLLITIILYPSVLFNGQISIVTNNLYRALKLQKDYTKNNIVALGISVIVTAILHLVFKNIIAISVATLISFYLWLLYSDLYFMKILKVNIFKLHVMELLITVVFIFCALKLHYVSGFLIYNLFIVLILILFYNKESKLYFKKFLLKFSKGFEKTNSFYRIHGKFIKKGSKLSEKIK